MKGRGLPLAAGAVAGFVLTACGDGKTPEITQLASRPGSALRVVARPPVVRPGGQTVLVLHAPRNHAMGGDLSVLERRQGGRWKPAYWLFSGGAPKAAPYTRHFVSDLVGIGPGTPQLTRLPVARAGRYRISEDVGGLEGHGRATATGSIVLRGSPVRPSRAPLPGNLDHKILQRLLASPLDREEAKCVLNKTRAVYPRGAVRTFMDGSAFKLAVGSAFVAAERCPTKVEFLAIRKSLEGGPNLRVVGDVSRVEPALSGHPAAPVCAQVPLKRRVGLVRLNPDTPAPRCLSLYGVQRLRLKNATGSFGQHPHSVGVALGPYAATLRPGKAVTFPKPVGRFLAKGTHLVKNGPALIVTRR